MSNTKTRSVYIDIPNENVEVFSQYMKNDIITLGKYFESYTATPFPQDNGLTSFTIRVMGKPDDVDYWADTFIKWLKRHTFKGRLISKIFGK